MCIMFRILFHSFVVQQETECQINFPPPGIKISVCSCREYGIATVKLQKNNKPQDASYDT